MNHRRHRFASAAIAMIGAAVLVAGCSSTGGKPRSTGDGMAAGTADTPRATVAMITHAPAGDSFWDLVQRGAETAAAKDNIELRYSTIPKHPTRPTSSRMRSTPGSTASPSHWPNPRRWLR